MLQRSCVLLGVLVTACAAREEPTSVLVEVRSDLEVGSELTEVRVQIFDRAGGNELSSRSIALTTTPGLPAQFELPASFALAPTERDVTDFRLVLTGRGPLGGGAVMDLVERQAIGTFVHHRQVSLPMFLSRACMGVTCRAGMELRSDLTCSDGECVSALTAESLASAPSTAPTRTEAPVSVESWLARPRVRFDTRAAASCERSLDWVEDTLESPDERR